MYKKTGKLIHKEITNGVGKASGKPWTKIRFIIETTSDPKYPSFLELDSFKGTVIEFVQDTSYGTMISVDFDVVTNKGRGDYEGKWFTNVNADHAEVVRQQESIVHSTGDHNGMNQLADLHGQQYNRATTVPDDDPSNDLPF